MNWGYFLTGTDTDCGKTHVACEVIRLLRGLGLRVAGFKPVAAGAVLCDGKLQNDDALALMAASGLDLPYDWVNPYCFRPPIAPHLAAADCGSEIALDRILDAFVHLGDSSDLIVAEGAGGWAVPLGRELDMPALASALGLPVVLVVGLRLGCLNHARLSAQSIVASGVALAGWIGSQVDPQMARVEDNIASLEGLLEAPCLGVVPHPSAPPLRRPRPLSVAHLEACARG